MKFTINEPYDRNLKVFKKYSTLEASYHVLQAMFGNLEERTREDCLATTQRWRLCFEDGEMVSIYWDNPEKDIDITHNITWTTSGTGGSATAKVIHQRVVDAIEAFMEKENMTNSLTMIDGLKFENDKYSTLHHDRVGWGIRARLISEGHPDPVEPHYHQADDLDKIQVHDTLKTLAKSFNPKQVRILTIRNWLHGLNDAARIFNVIITETREFNGDSCFIYILNNDGEVDAFPYDRKQMIDKFQEVPSGTLGTDEDGNHCVVHAN